MPNALYDYYKNYPADFKLVNEQFVVELAKQGKPIVLSIDLETIAKMGEISSEKRPTTYWEVFELLIPNYDYVRSSNLYLFEGRYYDVLVPPGK
ncbi:MAG: hypothetical protein IPJ47_01770 [Anaerolineales bacterium]|nr:hypothetical protein [Anaerolineales bacterium]